MFWAAALFGTAIVVGFLLVQAHGIFALYDLMLFGGVIAAAIISVPSAGTHQVKVQTRGGLLQVRFERTTEGMIHQIWLIGPAQKVFSGSVELQSLD